MPTVNQLLKFKRLRKRRKKRTVALGGCPQKKGVCVNVFKMNPRKPNSARRSVVKVRLYNKRRLIAFIPGIGHNLQKYNDGLVRGGRAKDLPGIRYTVIRGSLDLAAVPFRTRGRSKYGVIHPDK
jgi:small subunit ribosomal protein S12